MKSAAPLTPFLHTPLAAPEGDAVKFRLRGLTPLELADVTASAIDSVDDDGRPKLKYGSASIRQALGRGLLGWEGFTDANGNPLAFPADVTERINALGPKLMPELFWAILAASHLAEEDRKN
jgi:hypothetical protein